MRDIKFRVWNKTAEVMIKDVLDLDCGTAEVLMQYTGLKDKNGVEIYEGDVITYQEEPQKMQAKVVWKNGGFVFVYEDGTENITSESWYAPMDVEITEVIGNIYENPELLKEQS